MSHQHIAGKNFHIFIEGVMIKVEKATLKITDNMEPQTTNGIPDGYTDGDLSAEGDIEISYKYFKAFTLLAKAAGSYRDIPPIDIDFLGTTKTDAMAVKAFGCKLTLSSIVDAEGNGKEKGKITIPFKVTDSDFVHINGVHYVSARETLGIIG